MGRRQRTIRPYQRAMPTRWQRRTYAFGRYAVIAIPIFGLIAGLFPRSSAAFSVDPMTYARYVAHGRWQPSEAAVLILLGVTGVVSIVGLAALLFRGRARGFAIGGLVAGLVGTGLMTLAIGSVVVREDGFQHMIVNGQSTLAFNAGATGALDALLVTGGAVLLTAGWISLGVGIMRTSGMNRADGPLLMISAPLIFLGGMFAHVIPTMGSFLLVAAGLGIAFTVNRISVAGDMTRQQWRELMGTPIAAQLADPPDVPLDVARGLAGSLGLARPADYAASAAEPSTIDAGAEPLSAHAPAMHEAGLDGAGLPIAASNGHAVDASIGAESSVYGQDGRPFDGAVGRAAVPSGPTASRYSERIGAKIANAKRSRVTASGGKEANGGGPESKLGNGMRGLGRSSLGKAAARFPRNVRFVGKSPTSGGPRNDPRGKAGPGH